MDHSLPGHKHLNAPPQMRAGDAGAVIYTCPMHPQIRQLVPGACPICGMALEPVMPAAEEDLSELIDMTRRLWVSAGLTVPVFLLAIARELAGMPPSFIRVSQLAELVLATPV